jgi:hypothetical protein
MGGQYNVIDENGWRNLREVTPRGAVFDTIALSVPEGRGALGQ